MEIRRTQKSQNNNEKEEKIGGLRFLNFKTYGKFENYQNGIKLRGPHL